MMAIDSATAMLKYSIEWLLAAIGWSSALTIATAKLQMMRPRLPIFPAVILRDVCGSRNANSAATEMTPKAVKKISEVLGKGTLCWRTNSCQSQMSWPISHVPKASPNKIQAVRRCLSAK